MAYCDILQTVSERAHVSEREMEREMKTAIRRAGLTCSPQELIEAVVACLIKKDDIS